MNRNIRFRTPEAFWEFVKKDELARRIVEVFRGDNTDFLVIISLAYPNAVGKRLYKRLFRIYDFPQMNEYLRQFKEHTLDLSELVEIGTRIMHFDRDDIIKNMLKYKANQYRDKVMGAEPTPKRLTDIMLGIEQEIERLKNSGKENPMIAFLEAFLRDSRELLEMWIRTRGQFAAMIAREAREQS